MSGGVDRLHPRHPEVPLEILVAERRHEPPGGGVDVDRDVRPVGCSKSVERPSDLGDRLVGAVVGRTENRDDADRVLVAVRERPLGGQVGDVGADRYLSVLDVPVAAELLPADLDVGPGDQVRLVGGQAPAASRRCRQRHLSASPPSMHASLDPVVEQPVGCSLSSACQRWAMIAQQRFSISAVCGYSSLSIMFLDAHSAMSRSASGSIHVVTNVARLSRATPSSRSSSWMTW